MVSGFITFVGLWHDARKFQRVGGFISFLLLFFFGSFFYVFFFVGFGSFFGSIFLRLEIDAFQSQCSSQERLNHLPTVPTAEEMRMLSHHFSSGESQSGGPASTTTTTEETDGGKPSSSNSARCAQAVTGHLAPLATGHRSPRMRPRSRSLRFVMRI